MLQLNLKCFLFFILFSTSAHAQLKKWLVRDIQGQAFLVDFSPAIPIVSNTPVGYGYSSGNYDNEDNNLMTDSSGKILFSCLVYANNFIEVRDSTFSIMPNGSQLLGHQSTHESGIARVPCSNNKFYLIHSTITPSNLYYSVIDMDMNNGFGDVIQKNILVGNNIGEGKALSRQLKNGCRWLLVPGFLNSNTITIQRYLVSQTGISLSTVLDTIYFQQSFLGGPYEIEMNPDNSKIALSTHRDNPSDADFIVWDFDLNTGLISNQQDYYATPDQIHGIEFSGDGSKLYFLANSTVNDCDFGRVNLSNGSVQIIDSMVGRYLGVIEKAGNGKMYIAPNYYSHHLIEVANPDSSNLGSIGYNKIAINIPSTGLRSSLPSSIEGEPPGTTVTPVYIDFGYTPTGNCLEYQFSDSSCLGTWWEWDFGDSTNSYSQNPVHQFTQQGLYNVTLKMVACGDTITLTKNVFVAPAVNVQLNAFNDICISDPPLTLSGGTPTGGVYSGTGVSNGVFNPLTAGTGMHSIVYTYTDSAGCTGLAQQQITVYPFPVVPIISLVNDTLFASTNPSYATYTWFLNGTLLPGQTDSVLIPTQGGNYTLMVTDSNGCSIAVNLYVSLTSVYNVNDQNRITVLPNPFSQSIVVNFMFPISLTQLTIENAIGQEVYKTEVNPENERSVNINTSDFAKGIYFLRVVAPQQSQIIKLVKQ